MNNVIVSLKNMSFSYRQRHSFFRHTYYTVFNDVSFDVCKGETLGVIGRNGCGKSTLLRLISGIYKPSDGEIITAPGTSISLLSLQLGFDSNLSGYDNAVLSSILLGFSKKEAQDKLAEICEYSELGEFMSQPVNTYSSGMRSRLGFAIAMHMNPDVLLVDETLSVGDASFRKKAEATMLKKISSDQTVILVSHSGEQIKRVCDRAIWIEEHTNMAEGTPEDMLKLYYDYKS